MSKSTFASAVGIVGNALLFVIKIIVGVLFNSIALISDAFNSFTDILASTVVYISIRVARKSADETHPFGHHRAEPIASLVVAIFAGIVGFEIIRASAFRLIAGGEFIKGILPMLILIITIVIKLLLYIYTMSVWRKAKSTALYAQAIDHRNDILVSGSALLGVVGAYLGYPYLDSVAGLVIGIWIIGAGFRIAKDNMKYLMGATAPKEITDKITKKAMTVKEVKRINEIRAHYVGTLLQIEIHISVDRNLTIYRAHTIGKKCQKMIEAMPEVDYCFVHIDPIIKARPH
ncbi:MAG: cation diffusion facilitator family transporter [Nanoarchaeota archaeon]|nr:cation diffusion facilitator family transporter [Nanoarchaeota archaeon]MBU1703817.1 cation diffusion facilitator family transporter [Nanoarchaeota archaeon]